MNIFETADGRTLSYACRGSGPLLVCIPGGPGMDPEAYFAPMDLPGFEMLILAPRGTGESTPPPAPEGYRIAGYVSDVESLREHLDVERLMLYGNSHGGMVALAYAVAHPERVERFVVTNAPARMDAAYQEAVASAKQRFAETLPDGAERIAAAAAASEVVETLEDPVEQRRAFRTMMAQYVVHPGPAETAYLDRLCEAPMNWDAIDPMYEEMLEGLDLLEGADRVTAPALVIAGELDVTVPPAVMQVIAEALPNATYVEFPRSGHFVEVEAGESFTQVVCDFLRS